MEKALRDKKAILFFILPGLVWFTLIAIIPVFQSFSYSFLSWNGITKARITGLANYKAMFTSPLFYKSVLNSLFLAGASIFIQLPVCMILALVLAKGIKGEGIYRTLYFIPVIISSTIIAQLWAKIYHPNYGLLNTFLERIGMPDWRQQWLADSKFALTAVFVPMIWQYIGYHMLLFYSAAKSISPELREAALADGASETQIALRIIIPMITPMIKASIIFALIGSLKSFDMIYVLTRGGPLHATSVPTMLMYNEMFTNSRYGPASAIAIFTVVECLILTIVVQKIFKMIQGQDD
jgi:raffinose/stachyose/melibiose transport system permease protein